MRLAVDPRPVLTIIGYLVAAEGVAMLFPAAIDFGQRNPDWQSFAASSTTTVFVGTLLVLANRGAEMRLSTRQAVLVTVGSWLAVALFGSMPLWFASLGLSYTDAFFETMSGLTTTGSTVIVGLDAAPPGILLWRGLLQWLGGVGIIVMGLAVLPFLRVGGMQLFRLESSERSERGVPRFRQFVSHVIFVYVLLGVVCAVLLAFAGMSPLEAVVHAMTSLATGGFSTSDASIGHFDNPVIDWILALFMVLGSLPFVLYVRMLHGGGELLRSRQVMTLLKLLAVAVLAVTAWLWLVQAEPLGRALRLAAFNVISVVTTTGYATADYMQWGAFPITMFFMLTFVGGCTGSTAGGIKMFRFEMIARALRGYLSHVIYPHAVETPRYGGEPLQPDVITGGLLYVTAFVLTTAVAAVLLAALGLDLLTAASGAATAVANVGPGLGPLIGPAGNFAGLPDAAKWILAIAMLLGRLELFTVLVLFSPTFWRS